MAGLLNAREDDDVTTMLRDWKIDKRHFLVFVVHEDSWRRENSLMEYLITFSHKFILYFLFIIRINLFKIFNKGLFLKKKYEPKVEQGKN